MWEQLAYSFVTLLVIVDPVGTAAIFAAMMRGMTDEVRRRTAWQAVAIAGAILFAFALFGNAFLAALGITLPALRIAGGLLLFLLATDMVFARPSGIRTPTPPEQEEAAHSTELAVFPLAFPLIAGPGALTSIVLLMGRAASPIEQAMVIAALAAVLALAFAALLCALYLTRLLGVTGVNVVSRVLGVVLAALAAQLVLDGVSEFVHRAG
jgi:multiple antibiotic resistance protein